MTYSYFKKIHVTILLLILVILVSIILNSSNPITQAIIIAAFIIHAIIYIFMKSGLTSLLFTIGATTTAGIYTIWNFYHSPQNLTMENVLLFCSYSISLLIIWYLSYVQQKHNEVHTNLLERVENLAKYGEVESVYASSEFKERSLLLMNACKLREEDGYFVKLSFSTYQLYTHKAIHYTIGEKLASLIRHHIDLVGEYDEQSFIIFLQKTKIDEANNFIEKVFEELGKVLMLDEINLSASLYHYNEYDFEEVIGE